jgi:hypothetical protein
MARKRTSQSRAGTQSAPKKLRAHSKTTSAPLHIPTQPNQPYEQDSKRRIGHFVGVGEPPLMKK